MRFVAYWVPQGGSGASGSSELRCDLGLDIIAMDFPKEAKVPTDIPKGWAPPVIGNRQVMVDRIKKANPVIKFSDLVSGILIGDDFALQIDLGKEEECSRICFTARGNEKAVGAALEVLQLFEIRGIECANTSFLDLDPESPAALRKWREYLDQAQSPDPEAFQAES